MTRVITAGQGKDERRRNRLLLLLFLPCISGRPNPPTAFLGQSSRAAAPTLSRTTLPSRYTWSAAMQPSRPCSRKTLMLLVVVAFVRVWLKQSSVVVVVVIIVIVAIVSGAYSSSSSNRACLIPQRRYEQTQFLFKTYHSSSLAQETNRVWDRSEDRQQR